MSKDNRTFFSQKSEWAKVKDHLLAAYLEPYLAKNTLYEKAASVY